MKAQYFWLALTFGIGSSFFDSVGYLLLGIDSSAWLQWLLIVVIIEIGIIGTIVTASIWE
jgi:hypothetical protein